MKESEGTGQIKWRKSEDWGRNLVSQDILFNAKPSSRLLKKKKPFFSSIN